jgi:peptidoglycan/xylan/chitin deacetylase (PgdA/CDA1 family)
MAERASAGMPGAFVVSLDFELHWGVRDHKSVDDYRENLLGSREVIPRMLELFESYGIHATWATVGFLFCENREELLASVPACRPAYDDPNLSLYSSLHEIGEDERSDPFHYAPSLIERIRRCPGQEVGSHTFSHYFCLERGQDVTAFRADLKAAVTVAARRGIHLRSLVFPRNQINDEYLSGCREMGFVAYRGNEPAVMYRARVSEGQRLHVRLLRLADTYFNLSPGNAYAMDTPDAGMPVNVPSSRFLRPYAPLRRVAESARLRRIATQMTDAARRGLVYHLWWHPHNFGSNQEENLAFCRKILEHFRRLRDNHGMEAASMGELAARQLGVASDIDNEQTHRLAGRAR